MYFCNWGASGGGNTISILLWEECGAPRILFTDRIETLAEAVRVDVVEVLREISCPALDLDSEGERAMWVLERFCRVVRARSSDDG